MSNIPYDLKKIKAFVFDVDGVLSSNTIPLHPSGEPMRFINTKDGFAMQLAAEQGFRMGIISGGDGFALFNRFDSLGFKYIYLKSTCKIKDFNDFLQKTDLAYTAVCYVGDDIPDYEIMRKVGLPVCPADAAIEIKSVAKYISRLKGGEGIARDVIEQVLKAQGKWIKNGAFG